MNFIFKYIVMGLILLVCLSGCGGHYYNPNPDPTYSGYLIALSNIKDNTKIFNIG
jgi:hypothetical protein